MVGILLMGSLIFGVNPLGAVEKPYKIGYVMLLIRERGILKLSRIAPNPW